MMKTSLLTAVLSLAIASVSLAKTLENLGRDGLAIKGYDPVAYFTEGKAVKGSPAISSKAGNATYYFASEANKEAFDADPKKYEPQFGGFCAYAVSKGQTASIDPNAFMIVDGRLLLQYSLGVLKEFEKDIQGNLAKADANWPKLVEKKGK